MMSRPAAARDCGFAVGSVPESARRIGPHRRLPDLRRRGRI